MEELLNKLAEILDLGKDGAIRLVEMYPQLRHQFAWYKTLSDINWWAGVLIVVIIITTVLSVLLLFGSSDHLEEEEKTFFFDIIKKIVILFFICLAVKIAALTARNFLATDISIIYKMIEILK